MDSIYKIVKARILKENDSLKFDYVKHIEIVKKFLIPQIEKFLTKKGCLKEFIDNYNNHDGSEAKNLSDIFIKYKRVSLRNLISQGFAWRRTPQGHKYWALINDEYSIFISKLVNHDFNLKMVK